MSKQTRQKNIKKNTILKKAIELANQETKDHYKEFTDTVLTGFSGLMIIDEICNVPAKVIKEFKKETENEFPKFKGAIVDGDIYLGESNLEVLENISAPEIMMSQLLYWVASEAQGKKLYVLIDEYDQFTNEMVAYRFEEFKKVVGRKGWIRKFYETLKIGADDGFIDRTFITGVTPITLDSLTSGFNISTNLSTDRRLVSFKRVQGYKRKTILESNLFV